MGTADPQVFTVLSRSRRVFWGWLVFAGSLMPGGALPRRETELVILRVAFLAGSAYEWAHHERLGKRAGLDSSELEALHRDVVEPGDWSAREHTLITATDQLFETRDLDDATWQLLRKHLDERRAVEFLLLVGNYSMLAATLHTLRIEPDERRRR